MKLNLIKNSVFLAPVILVQCQSENKNIPPERPNILFAIADDISWPHMKAYGCKWVNTPGFDRVAKNGVLFNNAYTPNAKSAPSRSCILTGRNSWQLEEAANHVPFFPAKFPTFMEALGHNGYEVGCTAKGWAPGIALDSLGKPRQMTGKPFNSKKTVPPATGISNNDYSGNFADFLNTVEKGKPFCFWYGATEPHRKYEYGSGVSKGGKKLSDIDKVYGFWPDVEVVRNDMLDYAFEIENFDNHLNKMLDMLEEKGLLDNTIVIVTSDNGMPFPHVKGQVYEHSNHMPLAIMWGKNIKGRGRKVSDFISFIDIAPTILEIAGLTEKESGMQPIQGKSFTDIFNSRKKWTDASRNHVLLGKERHDVGRPDDRGYPVRGIVRDGFLYLINFKPQRWPAGNPQTGFMDTDGSPTKSYILSLKRNGGDPRFWDLCFGFRNDEELYNITKDPDCINNIATSAGLNNMKQSLRQQLLSELREQEDPRVLGKGDIFDKYVYAEEVHRNFFNRYMKGEISKRSAGWIDSTDFE